MYTLKAGICFMSSKVSFAHTWGDRDSHLIVKGEPPRWRYTDNTVIAV